MRAEVDKRKELTLLRTQMAKNPWTCKLDIDTMQDSSLKFPASPLLVSTLQSAPH
jgi:hypothetical protein